MRCLFTLQWRFMCNVDTVKSPKHSVHPLKLKNNNKEKIPLSNFSGFFQEFLPENNFILFIQAGSSEPVRLNFNTSFGFTNIRGIKISKKNYKITVDWFAVSAIWNQDRNVTMKTTTVKIRVSLNQDVFWLKPKDSQFTVCELRNHKDHL